jgi:predicted dithiol-disulfide oxidoreductase (DUF899 family)
MDIQKQINQLEEEILNKKIELGKLRRKAPGKEVQDYTFTGPKGEKVNLSELFDKHNQLFIIHNMGKSCPYCTLWADSLTGITPYLESRAGLALISPDKPQIMAEFAKSRGWNFKTYSTDGNTFKEDLGFRDEKHIIPGVSVFKKDSAGNMYHMNSSVFGPGDNYCNVFDYFAMLPERDDSWSPAKVSRVNS